MFTRGGGVRHNDHGLAVGILEVIVSGPYASPFDFESANY